MTIRVYGLKNCDTTRKALRWLREEGKGAEIVDLRADGLPPKTLKKWIDALGWETMLNRRGTTWRGLPESEKKDLTAAQAEALMNKYPALIKRPIIETKGGPVIGFKEEQKKKLQDL